MNIIFPNILDHPNKKTAESQNDSTTREAKSHLQLITAPTAQTLHVAIIDDDEATILYLTQYFSRKGIQTMTFHSPTDALAFLKTRREVGTPEHVPFDLIIADFKMPELDGLELTQKIKELYPNLPILLVSAYASLEVAMRAGQFGAEEILEKPLSLSKIDQLLDRLFQVK